MRALALAIGLIAVQPAQACHVFRYWAYKTPQRCGTRVATDDRVSVEITVTPELLETWARQDALARIKGELK